MWDSGLAPRDDVFIIRHSALDSGQETIRACLPVMRAGIYSAKISVRSSAMLRAAERMLREIWQKSNS